jgi:CheY-like chemotaxis protein
MNQNNLRILVVDDEEVVAEVLGKLIEVDGHNVAVTHKAKQALEAFQKEKFDIIFTDISMPEMDGIELTRKLLELDKDTRVVAITGHVGTQEIDDIMKAGAKIYMKKPFSKKDIEQTIKEIIKMS